MTVTDALASCAVGVPDCDDTVGLGVAFGWPELLSIVAVGAVVALAVVVIAKWAARRR